MLLSFDLIEKCIDKHRLNLIRIGLKFSIFFSTFLFLVLGCGILYWGTKTHDTFIYFFNTTNVSTTITYLNYAYNGNFFIKDFAGVLTFIGLFAIYGYFFTHIKTIGLKLASDKSNERGKMSISFVNSLYIILGLSVVITLGAIFGTFGNILPEKMPEIYFITFLLALSLVCVFLVKIALPKKRDLYAEYSEIIQFLKIEKYHDDFQLVSIFLFIGSFEVIAFGYLYGFNPVSIMCIDFLLLFLVWILGIFNAFPTNYSIIRLKANTSYEGLLEISNVYILDNNSEYVEFLQRDGKRVTINQDNIFFLRTLDINEQVGNGQDRECSNIQAAAVISNQFPRILPDNFITRNFLNLIGSVFSLLTMIEINFIVDEMKSLPKVPLTQMLELNNLIPFLFVLFIIFFVLIINCIPYGILGLFATQCDNY